MSGSLKTVNSGDFQIGPYSLHWASLPLRNPYHWAPGKVFVRELAIVRATLSSGTLGLGEIAFPPGQKLDRVEVERQMGLLAETWSSGGDPEAKLSAELVDLHVNIQPLSPVGLRVRCGMISAFASAQARSQGVDLAQVLSSLGRADYSKNIPINALVAEQDLAAALEKSRTAQACGIETVKVKLLGEEVADFERVLAIRREYPTMKIRLDPNGCWGAHQCSELLNRYSELNIEYVEDPLPLAASLEDYATLRPKSPIRIALDAPCRDRAAAQEILRLSAADVLVLKPQRVGGPDEVLRVAALAESRGIPVTLTGSLESAIGTTTGFHAAACLPQPISPCGLGTSGFFAEDFADMPRVVGGMVALADLPNEFGLPS